MSFHLLFHLLGGPFVVWGLGSAVNILSSFLAWQCRAAACGFDCATESVFVAMVSVCCASRPVRVGRTQLLLLLGLHE